MRERIIIAGSGGQGVMLLGKILAQTAMEENKFTSWLPSYGAEVRGGSAFCMVNISDREIDSPYIDKADTLIIFNSVSWERFSKYIDKGLVLLNSSLISKDISKKGLRIFFYPFSDLALSLGDIKIANMIALGVYLKKKNILKPENVFKTVKELIPKDKKNLLELNLKAIEEGLKIG
jgi:2-oxoglutarate ferredoxin oxidoreductase subunit gamma